MWSWGDVIEDKIKQAQDEGVFDDLPGQGKPLRLDDNSSEDWLGHHMLHEAGLLPDWLQLRKEIHYARPKVVQALRDYRTHGQMGRTPVSSSIPTTAEIEDRYLALARAINRKIDEHNRLCPSMTLELPRFVDDRETLRVLTSRY